jgi:hypothetical protein
MVISVTTWASARYVVIVATVCLTAAASGCSGKKVPSYKDRIGTIDPATAPVEAPVTPK